jgi:phosphoglycolate phosphatase-like HAD superfamily hydrolase
MRVAVDVDNVLADIIASAKMTLAEDLGLPVDEIVMTGIYHRPFGHPDPAIDAKLKLDHAFWDRPEVILRCPVLPGALDAMHRLDRAGVLAGYVTRRPGAVRETTRQWHAAVGLPHAEMRFVGTTDAATTYAQCKSVACAEIGANYLIDDHADEFATARAAGVEVIVVDAEIGRDRRIEVLSHHPDAILVTCASHAVDVLLERAGIAA